MPGNKWELLAPAGSMDALKAALANGADAVYLGAPAFGARASAGFDEASLREALALSHLHRKKIYVTVNILVKEKELSDVRKTLSLLSALGADAVLVQDLGILKIVREEFPGLPVHASTQMALHNESGVRLLKALGASRVVLARECDLNAIRRAAGCGIEIEAFCHGALCVGCSGQCLFSSMIGGRSGNRGRCAQPCRLPYTYQGRPGAWLSPRDLCARDELDALTKAGVYSFKIEGRLKRPEYVAVVTRAYRNALDALQEGRFSPMDETEKDGLTQIFSRGGFTQGYPASGRDAALIDPARVKPAGLPMGRVEKVYRKGGALLADVLLQRDLHGGDGLEIAGHELRYSGPEVKKDRRGAIRLRHSVQPGAAVRRTEDESQLANARNTYEGEALNLALPISFDAVLTARPGAPLALTVTDGESRVTREGDICQEAVSKALDEGSARRALEKTGGTPFVLRDLKVFSQDAFAPASALNALRRDALADLTALRIEKQPRLVSAPAIFTAQPGGAWKPRLIVKTQRPEEIPALLEAGADEALLFPQDFREAALRALIPSAWPAGARLCLPAQCDQDTLLFLRTWAEEKGCPVCLSSPGQLGVFARGDMAGEGVPVMNGEAIRMLSHLGCKSVTLSRELSKKEIQDLPRDVCELILPVYGRARLMLLNHCPMRTQMGLRAGRETCELCEKGRGAMGTSLTDRMGAAYPLLPVRTAPGCQIELMADKPLHLSGLLNGLPPLSFLLAFTDEAPRERLAVTRHYAALLHHETPAPLSVRGTTGRFLDGVE